MTTSLVYEEEAPFYERLDAAVKRGDTIEISFERQLLDDKSKLWPRLRKCRNWKQLEEQLEAVKEGKRPAVLGLLAPHMVIGLTGGEIFLFAWIASLLAAVLLYAVYKTCDAELEVDPVDKKLKLKLKHNRTPT